MSSIYFKANGVIHHLDCRNYPLPCEAIIFMGMFLNPAMSTQGTKVYAGKNSNNTRIWYDTSSPTIAFRKNDKNYYCSKSIKTAGKTFGEIVSTSVSSIQLSNHYYEKSITVNFKLSYSPSSSGIESPKYELKYIVAQNQGLTYSLSKFGDSFSGTTQNASYSSVLSIAATGGNPSAVVVVCFELWDALNKNKIASTEVTLTGSWTWSDSSSGGGGSGGE